MKKSDSFSVTVKVEGGSMFIGDHSFDLTSLKKAVSKLVDLSQEVPGEVIKYDSAILEEMSLPDLKDLWQVRNLLKFIDDAINGSLAGESQNNTNV